MEGWGGGREWEYDFIPDIYFIFLFNDLLERSGSASFSLKNRPSNKKTHH